MPDRKQDKLKYARDVMLAYDYWKRDFPADLARENPSAEAIHEYGNTSTNYKDFLGMVKNATDQLSKTKDNTPEELLIREKRSISELRDELAAAIENSKNV